MLGQAVNIDGPFLGCKHAIPAMAAAGGGSIINLASTASIVGTPPFAAYSATKGAVRAITQTVAVHCKQRKNGVQMYCIDVSPVSNRVFSGCRVTAVRIDSVTYPRSYCRQMTPAPT